MSGMSRDGARSLDVTDWVNADGDGVLSIVLLAPSTNLPASDVHSRESSWAPRLVLATNPGAVKSYCTSGTTTHGCQATLDASGMPSVAQTSGFVLTASNVEGDKSGILFYGVDGRVANPWGASFLCVRAPVQRTDVTHAGGVNGQCNGVIALDWLAYTATHPGALGAPFSVGRQVNAQCWFRDPPAPVTTNLSDALEFFACP